MTFARCALLLFALLPSTQIAYPAVARMRPTVAPLGTWRVSSTFGARVDPITGQRGMHRGIDLPGPWGTPVRAAAAGVVRFAGRDGGYGNMVEVDHGGGMATRYAHLASIDVRAGETVASNTMLGRMGSTGHSTGSHLHFELWSGGRQIDPLPYLRGGGVASAPLSPQGMPDAGPPHRSAFSQARAVLRAEPVGAATHLSGGDEVAVGR